MTISTKTRKVTSLRWWLKFLWAHVLVTAVTGRLDLLGYALIMTVPLTWEAWVKGLLPWKVRSGRTPD